MKIRWKLLILLLAISLVPLIASSLLHRYWARRLGWHLASGRRRILIDQARQRLQLLVDGYARILERDRLLLELSLTAQARAVEQGLAGPPPAGAPRPLFAEDIDRGARPGEGMTMSRRHGRFAGQGRTEPIPVSYRQQACFLVRGVRQEDVADDLARLSTMPAVYARLHEKLPALMHWQYTALASGVHTSYPAHGGYPAEFDPRRRAWYLSAKASGRLTWQAPSVDASTRKIMLALSMPVRRPDGSFAGVTGIDVPVSGVFAELELPGAWSADEAMLFVHPGSAPGGAERQLTILAQKGYEGLDRDWQRPLELPSLTSGDANALEALRREATAGRSGVREMPYRGEQAFWAHGAGSPGEPFPIIIVPHDRIVAQAVAAEQYVLDRTLRGLQLTGLVLLGVVAAAVVAALLSSRTVTRPVNDLAAAAERLAAGDYDAQVDIRTGDELEALGEAFNGMGPKLKERERMKRSLALAMEIQQHLLPQGPPRLAGFDVAGQSVYCDETGGDYYDFIELMELGRGKLGVAVGDVTGHGIGAAMLMASARGVLRSHAGRHGTDLSELFGELNRHLVRDSGDERFMTLFYGVLDAADRSLTWTSGGHDPPLWLRRASGHIEELPNTGIPLGILDSAAFERGGPVTLAGGDVILIGTDGIWEAARADGEMFGKQRLRELLSASCDQSAAEIHAGVVRAVREFQGAEPQADDITLVVIKAL